MTTEALIRELITLLVRSQEVSLRGSSVEAIEWYHLRPAINRLQKALDTEREIGRRQQSSAD